MSPRNLAFRILLISIVRFSTTSVIWPQRLHVVRLSPKPTRSLEPDRWRTVHPEFKAPKIEIQLTKDHISPNENWMFANEYKYSGKDYNDTAKMTSTTEKKIPRIENDDTEAGEEEKENDIQDHIVMPDIIPQIGSRNIITVPTYCPEGQREDSKGRCRTIIT